jgi:hypothetical protein
MDHKSADFKRSIYGKPSAGNVQSVNRLWKAGAPANEVIDSESVSAQVAA